MQPQQQNLDVAIFQMVIIIWIIIWKGFALWKAAKTGQKRWFIVLLLVSHPLLTTIGLLEIAYLFFFAKDKVTIGDIKKWIRKHLLSGRKETH